MLEEYFKQYLKEIRKLSDSTIKHYITALNFISKILKKNKLIINSIYEVDSISRLTFIREVLFKDMEFMLKDTRGHQMYSAGLNNYYQFALGKDFKGLHKEVSKMDIKLPIKSSFVYNKQYNRDKIIIKQVIESTNYKCEVDNSHLTFISEATNNPYMEGHHIIPLKYQNQFKYSLDIYANILAVCPICHRMLHYGRMSDKEMILKDLYNKRKYRLYKSGIKLSKFDFIDIVKNK